MTQKPGGRHSMAVESLLSYWGDTETSEPGTEGNGSGIVSEGQVG